MKPFVTHPLSNLEAGNEEAFHQLAAHLIQREPTAALSAIADMTWQGVDAAQIHQRTLTALRAAHLNAWQAHHSLDLPQDTIRQLEQLNKSTDPAHILHAIDIWNQANPKGATEPVTQLEIAAAQVCGLRAAPAQQMPPQNPPLQNATPPPANPKPNLSQQWNTATNLLSRHKGTKFNLGALLRDCRPQDLEYDRQNGVLSMTFTSDANYQRTLEELRDPLASQTINQALRQAFQNDIHFHVLPPKNRER